MIHLLWFCCTLLGLVYAQTYGTELAATHITDRIFEGPSQPLEVDVGRNSYVTRDGSALKLDGKPWKASGANVYWLGLDENVRPPAGQPYDRQFHASYPTKGRITEIMNTLQIMGATTIRSQTLGVSVGNSLSLEPELGVFNDDAFATIDWAIYQAREHGLRIVAPLTDNYDYYHGGKYVFLRWRGINITRADGYSTEDIRCMQFYTNRDIIDDFKAYIRHLLTHVNPYTKLSYAEDPTIFAYETGNELGGPTFQDKWVPTAWISEISAFIKELAPNKLVVDGTYGINTTHLAISTVDIYSDHYYPLDTSKLANDLSLVESAKKVYIAGEYDWTDNRPGPASLSQFYRAIETQAAKSPPVIAGDMFWSLFMHDVPNCEVFVNHSDGYTMQYGNPLNTGHINSQISLVREHLWKINHNETVAAHLPAVPCPGPTTEFTKV